jgi:hypothetical protein
MTPRATLEIPGSGRRLDRIFQLISSCPYSIHDLSRVQLDRASPRTPRFNMPFELGLAVAHEKSGTQHVWFVFETVERRVLKSLSDLNGSDVYIHRGAVDGVFAQLGNAFVRIGAQPTVAHMRTIYRGLRSSLPRILRETGSVNIFEARPFQVLSTAAIGFTQKLRFGSGR